MSKFILILLLVGIMSCSGGLDHPWYPVNRDGFKISLVWPNSYCWSNNLHCRSSIPQYFVLKSFWAQNTTLQPMIHCPTDTELSDDTISRHKFDLLKYWPDLSTYNFENSKQFWKYQWYWYGSCGADLMVPEAYVNTALKLRQIHNMYQILKSSGIVANGNSYTTDKIFAAIKKYTRVTVDIVCEADIDQSNTLFSEIHLCVDDEGKNFVDCERVASGCDRDPIFPDSLYR